MHRVFISYHYGNDQQYKDALVAFAEKNQIFIDVSVDTSAFPTIWTTNLSGRRSGTSRYYA